MEHLYFMIIGNFSKINYKFYLHAIFIIVLLSCQNKIESKAFKEETPKHLKSQCQDTIIALSDDSSCFLEIKYPLINSTNNAVVLFHLNNELIYRDSIQFDFFELIRKDVNNDGTKDILIFHSAGVRPNLTYYLYLVDQYQRKLTRVSGFEELSNPDVDGNIITSYGLAGSRIYFNFYKLNRSEIINLGNGFDADAGNYDKKYNQTINHINDSIRGKK